MKKNLKFVPLFALLALLGAPAFVHAEVGATAGVTAEVKAPAVGAKVDAKATASAAVMLRGKDRAHQEIDRRNASIAKLVARVEAMKNLSDTDKATITATLKAQVNALNALATKIDADTDAATLKTDVQSITSAYRIYALIIPQGAIIAAADRIVTLSGKLRGISAKFDARLTAATTAGMDVTALRALLADYNTKVADAAIQAQAAVNAIVKLVPDEGDAAKKKANEDALKAARAQIVAGQKDINDARKIAEKILVGLKTLKASATTTTEVKTEAGQ